MLAPFCKIPLNITMKGVTNNKLDPSVDMIRSTLLPVLKKFLVVDDGLSLKMIKRGLPPSGGGVVTFTCPVRRTLKPFQWEESGKIKRIRGVAYTSRVTPTVANRMLDAAKGEFLKFLTDVYLAVDNAKGSSPGSDTMKSKLAPKQELFAPLASSFAFSVESLITTEQVLVSLQLSTGIALMLSQHFLQQQQL
ncbi:RNA 3'-terminal phosphate cyclase-like 3 [Homarus americanus]|uniref:RNA 3'-terminal phosphate cyclase-like 3 n=1 Tax=Homarus americanus TaxID=6706 RepID=A0A8J5NCR7_HOMAM|nr:RNA 3'-terminal phosphate cyclase-like 3 [Homarus americanus]